MAARPACPRVAAFWLAAFRRPALGALPRPSAWGAWLPSLDRGPGLRVHPRAAGAASQSAKPRAWRRPSPPPQPTQPVPVQNAEQAPLEGLSWGLVVCCDSEGWQAVARGKRARGGWLRTRKMGNGRCLTREMSSIGGFLSARVRGSCDGVDGREAIRTMRGATRPSVAQRFTLAPVFRGEPTSFICLNWAVFADREIASDRDRHRPGVIEK